MNKVVKVSMIGIGIVTALLVAALILFVFSFDLNDYKDRISSLVQEETGRTLHFESNLDLMLFPSLGVELGGVNLSNAQGFGDKPMIEAASARVFVRLMPLLGGDIRFGHMELDGLKLNLSRDAGGATNWDDLVGRADEGDDKPVAEEGDKDLSLEIEGVTIKDASLVWDDKAAGSRFDLHGVNLTTGRIERLKPFPVEAKVEFESARPQIRGSLSFSGMSSIDFVNNQYEQKNLRLSVSAEGQDIPGGKGAAELELQSMVLDLKAEKMRITGLSVDSYGAAIHLDGSVEGIASGLRKIASTATIDPFDLRKMLAAMGLDVPVTADNDALTRVGGMLDLIYTPGTIQVKGLQADLDGTSIEGSGRVRKSEDDPAYLVRLNVGKLDLDRYLPPESKEEKASSKGAEASGTGSDRIVSAETLRRLNLDIEARLEELKVKGVRMQNVKAEIKARHGLIRISPVSADSYGGKISTGATINAMGKYPKTDLIIGVDKLDIGALSKDVSGKASYAGIAHFNSAVSCEGDRLPALLRSMNGKVGFSLADGVFPGVDLMQMAKATHERKDTNSGTVESASSDSTKFGSISGTGVIAGGILRNRDLEVKTPGLRASGQGAIDIASQQIDYLVKVKLTPTAKGQGGKSSDELYGVMVPIRVSGDLAAPRYWVSVSEYVKALGGAVIGTAGAVLGGVKSVVKGVGTALGNSSDEDGETEKKDPEKRKRFLGIF